MNTTRLAGLLCALGILSGCGTVARLAENLKLVDLAKRAFGEEHGQRIGKMIDTLKSLGSDTAVASLDGGGRPSAGGAVPENRVSQGEEPQPIPSASKKPKNSAGSLNVDFDVVRQRGAGARASVANVSDGDVLTERDNYKVVFTADRECYVYVFQIDSVTKVDPIWPDRGERVRVSAGKTVTVPAGDEWFFLDENRGVEHVFLVASLSPVEKIEELFRDARGATWKMREQVSVEEAVVINRGIGGKRKGGRVNVAAKGGTEHAIDVTAYTTAGQVAVTRWFRHE